MIGRGSVSRIAAVIASGAILLASATDPIGDSASAIQAAKRYLKHRCTAQMPCRFRAEREGRQWRVWVRLGRLGPRGEAVYPNPGTSIILFFDTSGNLIRRLEGE